MKRKLFGTDGIRGRSNSYPMTSEMALALGRAMTLVLKKRIPEPRIVIGKDTRRSGYMLETALTSGVMSMGGRVFLLGPLPTPAVAYHIQGLRAHGGVMISASHNPYEDNGLKVFGEDGFKLEDELEEEIESLILGTTSWEDRLPGPENLGRTDRVEDALGRYLVHLKTIFRRDFDLSGMKIVFDAANGAAYDCGPRLFRELGAELVPIACSPNGFNINKDCAQESVGFLERAVIEERADIGIAVDGDADRLMIVDETGKFVSGEHVMFSVASFLKDIGRLDKSGMVTTSMANQALEIELSKKGIQCHRADVGDRYVTAKLKQESCIFGGETSGHFIFLDQNTTADGLFSALEVLALLKSRQSKASALQKTFKLFPQKLMSVPVKERKPLEKVPRLQEAILKMETQYQGRGRVNVRYSGTQLMLRVMVEGPDLKQIENDLCSLEQLVREELG
jgi:phosphoglucosamine mutase